MVFVCPNAFKGTVTARGAARALADGIRCARPDLAVTEMPLADGGDGTAAVLARALGGRPVRARVPGPLGAPLVAHAYRLPPGAAAAWAADLASAVGMRRLPAGPRRPLDAGTAGLGVLLGALGADADGPPVWVGLGGSASTDGGAGALLALGFRLLDRAGRPVPPGAAGLLRLARAVAPAVRAAPPITVLADVRSPLLGPDGAAARFGPQKGAAPAQIAILEDALCRWREVAERDLGAPNSLADALGSGAAGGTAYGLAAGLGARVREGAGAVLEALGAPAAAAGAHVLLTGEGRIDATTGLGKAPAAVAELAAALRPRPRVIAACALAEEGIGRRLAGLDIRIVPRRDPSGPVTGGDLRRASARWAQDGLFDPGPGSPSFRGRRGGTGGGR